MNVNDPAIPGAVFVVALITLVAIGVYEAWRWYRRERYLPPPDRSATQLGRLANFERNLYLNNLEGPR